MLNFPFCLKFFPFDSFTGRNKKLSSHELPLEKYDILIPDSNLLINFHHVQIHKMKRFLIFDYKNLNEQTKKHK